MLLHVVLTITYLQSFPIRYTCYNTCFSLVLHLFSCLLRDLQSVGHPRIPDPRIPRQAYSVDNKLMRLAQVSMFAAWPELYTCAKRRDSRSVKL